MPTHVIESSEFHRSIHEIVGNTLIEKNPPPRYEVPPAYLNIRVVMPGKEDFENVFLIRSIVPERSYFQQGIDRGRETPYSQYVLPLHWVAEALRKELGETRTYELNDEYKHARKIAGQRNELGEWGGLYVATALFIEHHRAQKILEGVLSRHEEVIGRAEQVRLARERGNQYIDRGLHIVEPMSIYPLEKLQQAAVMTVNANANLLRGFDSDHFVEPTSIQSIDHILAQNGLMALPERE